MADIFISYAREDRETVAKLAAALAGAGCSVWWDRNIMGGAEFSAEIERELSVAKAVIVAWSAHANASHWVKDEAAIARDAGKLVPIALDGAEPPIGFRQFHAIDFKGWKGDAAAPTVAALKQSLKQKIDAGAGDQPAAAPASSPARVPSVWQVPVSRFGFIAALTMLALAAAALAIWRPWETRRGGPAGAEHAALPAPLVVRDGFAPPEKSIAVLPFVDLSEKKDQEYFTDGLSEEMIDLIAKIPELRVTARTSSFYFKGKPATIAEIAKALNVAHVLEGSVRKSGKRLRITAQLIRTSDSSHLWSETYDRTLDDIFKVQDEIADAVVKELKVSLLGGMSQMQGGVASSGGAVQLREVPTTNTEAYALYLQGRALVERYTAADVAKGTELLRRSVALDPDFAMAWVWLAAGFNQSFSLFAVQRDYERFQRDYDEAINRALALDPSLPEVHAQLGFQYWFRDNDDVASERELRKAIELGPANVRVLTPASLMTLAFGRTQEAVQLAERAVAVDPLAIDAYRALATAQHFGGKLAEAEATFRHGLEISPLAEGFYARLGLVLISAGRPQEALAVTEREPGGGRRAIVLAMAYDALGRRADADKALGDPEKLALGGWYYQLAELYAHRGENDKAFAMLDRGFAAHDGGVWNYTRSDPFLAPLRHDPRYKALLIRLSTPVGSHG